MKSGWRLINAINNQDLRHFLVFDKSFDNKNNHTQIHHPNDYKNYQIQLDNTNRETVDFC